MVARSASGRVDLDQACANRSSRLRAAMLILINPATALGG